MGLSPTPRASEPAVTIRPGRTIQRNIPLTSEIRRAFAAGTRDSTGRPGRNYWQLWTDYTIEARLDPTTSTVTGHEIVVIQNNSDSVMRQLVLRFDQNLFSAASARRGARFSDTTDGMRITRLTVNGQNVDLATGSGGIVGTGAASSSVAPVATGLDLTSARISLPTAIVSGGRATLEAEWSFRVPQVVGQRMGRWSDSLSDRAVVSASRRIRRPA